MKSTGTCLRCGELLPKGSSRSRLFCPDCAKERNIELTVKRQQQAQKARAALASQRVVNADKAYCKKCLYRNKSETVNLCDYILRTGHRRGCPAGAGCDKRQLARR